MISKIAAAAQLSIMDNNPVTITIGVPFKLPRGTGWCCEVEILSGGEKETFNLKGKDAIWSLRLATKLVSSKVKTLKDIYGDKFEDMCHSTISELII